MGNYRSEYERYYKNINNPNKDKVNNKYISGGAHSKDRKDVDNKTIDYGINKYFTLSYWNKRELQNLTGALAILVLFSGLKYIKSDYTRNAYLWCKNLISYDFNYDSTIEYIGAFDLGNYRVKDVKVGNFTIDDLKYENLKNQFISSKNYIEKNMQKNLDQIQKDTSSEEKWADIFY